MKLRLKRSNVVENGGPKPPTAAQMEYGELAINYDGGVGPVIFTKDDNNAIVKILPKVTTLVLNDNASSVIQTIGGKLKTENTVSGDADETLSTKKYVDDVDTANLARTVLDDVSTNQQIAGKISLTTATTSSDSLLTLTDRTYVDAGDALRVPIAGGMTMGGVLGWHTSQTFPAAKVTGTLNNANTGNAATATALATARTIGGTSFDGTANIEIAKLNNQVASYYLDASNLNAGTVPDARLPSASTSDAGIVQLTAATNSSSTTLAPTAAIFATTHVLAAAALSTTDTNSQTMAGNITFNGSQQLPTGYLTAGALPAGVTVASANIVNGTITDTDISSATGDRISGSKIQQAGANEANYGVIKLTDAINTTSSLLGASATAVKAAYDKAASTAVTVNESAPTTGLLEGDLWWDNSTNSGSCFIYYDSYWVPLVASAGSIDYTRTVLRDITDLQTITSKVQADSSSYTVTGDNSGTLTTKGYVDTVASAGVLAGGTMTGNLTFSDNLKAIFGSGTDLSIYHSSNINYIESASSLALVIGSSANINARFIQGDASEFYFNNSLKAKTVTAGFNVTGNLGVGDTAPADKLVVKGQSRFGNADNISPSSAGNGHLMITSAGYTGYLTCDNNAIYLGQNSSSAGLVLQTNEANRLFISSGGNVGIGTGATAPSSLLQLKGTLPVLEFNDTDVSGSWLKVSLESSDSVWETNGASAYGTLTVRQSSGGGATRDVLTIDSTGKVIVPLGDFSVSNGDILVPNGTVDGVDVSTIPSVYAPLASPTLTGTPAAPTAAAGTNTTQLATTAFVTNALSVYAPLASPTLTGTPAAPTAAAGTNTTQLATTAFVTNALSVENLWDRNSGTSTLSPNTAADNVSIAGNLTVSTTALVIDSTNKKVTIGYTEPINWDATSPIFNIAGTDFNSSTATITRFSDDANPPHLTFGKCRSSTIRANPDGTYGEEVLAGDILGQIEFAGSLWSPSQAYHNWGCFIRGEVDKASDLGNISYAVPGALTFWTYDKNTVEAPHECMRIDSEQRTYIGINDSVNDNRWIWPGANRGKQSLMVGTGGETYSNDSNSIGQIIITSAASRAFLSFNTANPGNAGNYSALITAHQPSMSTSTLTLSVGDTLSTNDTSYIKTECNNQLVTEVGVSGTYDSSASVGSRLNGWLAPAISDEIKLGSASAKWKELNSNYGTFYGSNNGGETVLLVQGGPWGINDYTTLLIEFTSVAVTGSGIQCGQVRRNGYNSVNYGASSDYRLKENVSLISDGIVRLKQLKPSRFNFIGEENERDGFLAHEAQTVVPESVCGEKDEMKEEKYEVTPATDTEEAVMGTRSVPAYQNIDQAKLVPLLTAALQETVNELEILKARVATLENS